MVKCFYIECDVLIIIVFIKNKWIIILIVKFYVIDVCEIIKFNIIEGIFEMLFVKLLIIGFIYWNLW